jgi:hypothetical protein
VLGAEAQRPARRLAAPGELFRRVVPNRGRLQAEVTAGEGEHVSFDIEEECSTRNSKRVSKRQLRSKNERQEEKKENSFSHVQQLSNPSAFPSVGRP